MGTVEQYQDRASQDAAERPRKRGCCRSTCVGCLTVTVLLPAWFFITFCAAMVEQLGWQPQDGAHLTTAGTRYSNEGIAITVYAPSGVDEAWTSGSPFLWPWRDCHRRMPFHVLATDHPDTYKILVEFPLYPGAEWLLALRSTDGYWASMSPYFPEEPDISDEEWREMIDAAQLVQPTWW